MSTIFTRGKVNEIFFKLGKFDGDTKGKFIHAPLDRLELDGDTFLNTRCFKAGGGLSEIAPWVSQNDDVNEEWKSARDLFSCELNPVVIGDYELGNWQEQGDSWIGVHKLGFI